MQLLRSIYQTFFALPVCLIMIAQSAYADCDVVKIGHGKPMIVLHGAGLNYRYMYEALKPISSIRQLIFYNQVSCKEPNCASGAPALADFVEQLSKLSVQYPDGYGVIAHSWGSLVLWEFLKTRPPEMHPDEIIFVSPIALRWEQMIHDASKIMQQIPDEDKQAMEHLAQHPSGCKHLLNYILPFYIYPGNENRVTLNEYQCFLDRKVITSIQGYDYSDIRHYLPRRTLWMYGERDVYTPDPHIGKWYVVEQSGHFPFLEQPQYFMKLLVEFLQHRLQ